MYGTNVGNLTVYLQDGPQKKMVFQRKSNQVNLWIHSALTLRPISSKFQVRQKSLSLLPVFYLHLDIKSNQLNLTMKKRNEHNLTIFSWIIQ